MSVFVHWNRFCLHVRCIIQAGISENTFTCTGCKGCNMPIIPYMGILINFNIFPNFNYGIFGCPIALEYRCINGFSFGYTGCMFPDLSRYLCGFRFHMSGIFFAYPFCRTGRHIFCPDVGGFVPIMLMLGKTPATCCFYDQAVNRYRPARKRPNAFFPVFFTLHCCSIGIRLINGSFRICLGSILFIIHWQVYPFRNFLSPVIGNSITVRLFFYCPNRNLQLSKFPRNSANVCWQCWKIIRRC